MEDRLVHDISSDAATQESVDLKIESGRDFRMSRKLLSESIIRESPPTSPSFLQGTLLRYNVKFSQQGPHIRWFSPDLLGTTYDISDADGRELLISGTICSSSSSTHSSCDVNLRPGEYFIRVTGALFPYRDLVNWQFCNTEGKAQQELKFVLDMYGRCSPIAVSNISDICSNEDNYYSKRLNKKISTVTVKGSLNLKGFQNSYILFDVEELNLISTILGDYFFEAGISTIPLGKSDVKVSQSDTVGNRTSELISKEERNDVQFHVRLSSHNRNTYKNIDKYVGSLKAFLTHSNTKQIFKAKLLSTAKLNHRTKLLEINLAEFSDITILHESRINQEISILADIIIIFFAFVGVIFGVIILRKTRKPRFIQLNVPVKNFPKTLKINKISDAAHNILRHDSIQLNNL